MTKEEFNSMHRYIGKNGIAYILFLKGKNVVNSDERSRIIDYVIPSKSLGFMRINASLNTAGSCSIQNIVKNGNKCNALMFNHTVFLDILSQLGLNIDYVLRKKAVYIKYYKNIEEQEKRWVRNKQKDFIKKVFRYTSMYREA